jgi:hypothetical protein
MKRLVSWALLAVGIALAAKDPGAGGAAMRWALTRRAHR